MGPRQQAVLGIAASSPRACTRDDCRYVALVTIRRSIALTSQPDRTNSVASQSSSSGWLGGSPWAPKSSTVFTSPVPKSICQSRLTATRAVSGLAGSTSQRASASRSAFAACGRRRDRARDAGIDTGPGWSYWPRIRTCVGRGAGISCMTIVVGIRSIIASSSAARVSISPASRRIAAGASVARKHRRIFAAWPGVRLPGGMAAIFVIDSGAARIAMASGPSARS